MKILIILLFLFGSFIYSTTIACVATIFSEPMTSNSSGSWIPTTFSNVNGTTPASYSKTNGIQCLNGNICQYEAPITAQDNIIKFDIVSDGNPENLLFSCRDANSYNDEFRVFLHADGTTHLERFYEGGGLGVDGLPNYDYSQGIHHIELSCIGPNFSFKEDGAILASSAYSSPSYGIFNYIRFNMWKGNWIFSNYQFCDSSGCDEAITPTPTPTPTPEINLNVPLIKQTDNPWQSQEYDTAHLWSPTNPTIHDWGCALTSAVMTLKFNDIKKMPDNSDLDPGTLNTWLKGQPDGYIGNGLVNWLAISRLTKLAAPRNREFTYDALEYQRQQGTDTASLSADLRNNIPDILEEPGHFIIAKGTQGSTFTINDPFYDRSLLTDSYSNSFLSAGKYIPSYTDLSYFLFTGSEDLSFYLKTATESGLGQQFIQNPLINEITPSQTSGQSVKLLYLQHPATNTYQLTISSPISQIYNLKGFAYDKQGNVKVFDVQGIIDNAHPNTFSLDYNNNQLSTSILQKHVTISELLFDLNMLYGKNMIKKSAYITLKSLLSNMQTASDRHRVWEVKLLLNVTSLILNVEKWRGITEEAYLLLNNDIASLKTSL